MLLNYLQASALLLSPKDNRNQGYRMERLGLRARDREDTLGFGPKWQGQNDSSCCSGSWALSWEWGGFAVWQLHVKGRVSCALGWRPWMPPPFHPWIVAEHVPARAASWVICFFPNLQIEKWFCMVVLWIVFALHLFMLQLNHLCRVS